MIAPPTTQGRLRGALFALLCASLACACQPLEVTDNTLFRMHEPRSILVLPPVNESIEVEAEYSYLSTVSRPLVESGYYVFPVAMVDAMMKDNGLPTPDEMHGVALSKLAEVFGADAVLYVTIRDWGQKFQILSSNTVVSFSARLVDVQSATTIWDGQIRLVDGSGGSGDIWSDMIAAVIEQVIDSKSDLTHGLARRGNIRMLHDRQTGLPYGWRHPLYQPRFEGLGPQ